jgi:hypothetical protein
VADDVVARVGPHTLTEAEVARTVGRLALRADSAEARAQIVEQWVTRMLLLEEAERRDLRAQPEVRRRLAEQERAVLVSALTERLYDAFEAAPSRAEVRAYYERHQAQLRLRQPYVRLRHLATATADAAEAVRQRMRATAPQAADSVWAALVARYATGTGAGRDARDVYVPEGQAFPLRPVLREQAAVLYPGEWAPPFQTRDGRWHVIHFAERLPADAVPPLAWVEDDIRERLTIRARKQMYAREVQRLRTNAMARGDLDLAP